MSDDESDDEFDEYIDDIIEAEEEFDETDKIHNSYYIGAGVKAKTQYIMMSSVSVASFFDFSYENVVRYLCLPFEPTYQVDILHLQIQNGIYFVILKTFWIRIIQRTWRHIFKTRCEIIAKRRNLKSIQYMQMNGRYPDGLNYLPTIYGMIKLKNN